MNNEGKGQEGQEGQESQGQAQETGGFNPDAFSAPAPINENDGSSSNNNGNEGNTSGEGSEGSGASNDAGTDGNDNGDNGSGVFHWGSDLGDGSTGSTEGNGQTSEGQTQASGTEGSEGNGQQAEGNEGSSANPDTGATSEGSEGNALAISDEQFSAFSEDFGLKAKNKEEFRNELKSIQEENERLKKNYPKTNEKIDTYEKLVNLEDNELVRQNLIADGFKGEDLENAVERYLDNGLIDIEAKKIRNTLNNAIVAEKQAIVDSDAQEDAKQIQEREEGITKLNSFLSSTDEMFGFKMAAPENIDNVRKTHQEYITSGNFLQEITKDSKALAESAWLWRNKEVILKAMLNQGFNKGTANVINQIGNPDPDAGTRTFVDPKDGTEFDAKKFAAR